MTRAELLALAARVAASIGVPAIFFLAGWAVMS